MLQYNFSNQWHLQTGIRYNHYVLNADFNNNLDFFPFPESKAKLNNGALIGSLGITYQPDQTWQLTLNLATGFRAPNVDDIGKVFDSEPGAVVIPNPNLDAERAYNLEFNIAKVFGERIKVDFSAYYTWLDQALVRRDFQLNGQDSIVYDGVLSQVQAIQNSAVARVYGIQAGLEVKFPAGFFITIQVQLSGW